MLTLSERILLGYALNKVVDEMLVNPNSSNIFSNEKMVGYYGLGMFLFALSHYMLYNDEIQNNYENINFASRDGYLPQKVYDIIRHYKENALESKYIYGGRLAYDISKFDNDLFKYLSSKTNHMPDYTLKNLFDALIGQDVKFSLHTEKLLKETIYNKDAENNFTILKTILHKEEKNLTAILKTKKELSKKYYSSNIKLSEKNRAIIFDVGYSGSVSESLCNLTGGLIDKIYLWETNRNVELDKQNNTNSFLLCGNQDIKVNKPQIELLIEELFSPLEGGCTGFVENNEKIVTPIVYNEEFSLEMKEALNVIQNSAIEYTNDIIKIINPYLSSLAFSNISILLNPMNEIFTRADDFSSRFLDNIVFADSFSRTNALSIASKMESNSNEFFYRTNFLDSNLIITGNDFAHTVSNKNLAIHIHLFNLEQSSFIIENLRKVENKFDVLISVCKDEHIRIAEKLFSPKIIENMNRRIIKLVPNRGRDVAPLLVGFNEEQKDYDLVCHIHTKKSVHFDWGIKWSEYLTENLISSSAIKNIVQEFENDKNLGIVYPPIYKGIYNFWNNNNLNQMGVRGLIEVCSSLLSKMNIDKKVDRYSLYYSVGNMFWYRPDALKPLFNMGLKYSDFPEEPIQVDGTIAHAIERLHSIVADSRGFKTLFYINSSELKNEYYENVLLGKTKDSNSSNEIIANQIDSFIDNGNYFGATMLITNRLFAAPKDKVIKEKLVQLNEIILEGKNNLNWSVKMSNHILSQIDALIAKQNYFQAKNLVLEIINLEPTNIDAIYHLSNILLIENKINYAREVINFALMITSKNKKFEKLKEIYIAKLKEKELANTSKKSSDKVDVSIIIITYNQYEYTSKCIKSLLKYTNESFEIVVIDNASKDDSGNKIKKDFPGVHVYCNNNNLGFPKAVNQGIVQSKGDYVLILNNDTVVTAGWLERMIEVAESDPKIGIVGPISNEVSGLQKDNDAKYETIEEMHKYAAEVSTKNKGEVFNFPRVAFLCTLIKRKVINEIGGLDERFSPGNYEDDDFCLRSQMGGYKTVIAKDVFIHHYGSKSFKANGIEAYRERLNINKQIFIEKWGATPDEIWINNKEVKPHQRYYPVNKNLFMQYFERTKIHLSDNEPLLAEEAIKSAIENYTNEVEEITLAELYNLAGNLSFANGNLESAKESYEKELNENPNSSGACFGLGQVFIASDELEGAKVMLEWAVKNDENNFQATELLEKVNAALV